MWKFRDANIEFVLSRVLRAGIKSQQLRPHSKLVGKMGGGSPEVARPTAINPPTNITWIPVF